MSELVGCAASALTAPLTGLSLKVKSCPPLVGAGPCSTQSGIPTTEIESSRRSSRVSNLIGRIAEASARIERAREFLRRVMTVLLQKTSTTSHLIWLYRVVALK